MRTSVTVLACATICLGQAPQGTRTQIDEQERRNATTLTVQPGTVGPISFVLHPQVQGSDEILVRTPEKTLDLSLRLPNGTLVDSKSAASVGLRWKTDSGIWVLGLCEGAESWEVIQLPPGAQGGQYTLEGKLPGGAQPVRLCATAFTIGALQRPDDIVVGGDWVRTDRVMYQVGDSVRISLPVLDGGQAVRGARVEAVILQGDRDFAKTEVGRLQFGEADSDGEYVGIFQPQKPGYYQVRVTISGRKGVQVGNFHVYPAVGTLLSAEITNADGQLQVVMRFRFRFPGEYRIQPTFSCSGKTTNYQTVRDLAAGEQEVITPLAPDKLKQQKLVPPCELIGIHVNRKDPSSEFGYELVGWWFNKDGQWQSR